MNSSVSGTLIGDGVGYSEYFETTDGKSIDVGCTVCLDNGKVRIAGLLDNPIGVVRPKTDLASVVGIVNNSYENYHHGIWERDEFNRIKLESHVWVEWKTPSGSVGYREDQIPQNITPPENATRTTIIRYKRAENYNPDLLYVPRSKRPEWVLVGLLGQLPVKTGQRVGNWIFMRNVGDGSVAKIYLVK